MQTSDGKQEKYKTASDRKQSQLQKKEVKRQVKLRRKKVLRSRERGWGNSDRQAILASQGIKEATHVLTYSP